MAKLAQAFPSAPKHPGRFVLYISHRGDVKGDRDAVYILAAPYSTKKFLDILLADDDLDVRSDKTLESSSGIIVRCNYLREVLDHEYTLKELAWDLPYPYNAMALHARTGKRPLYQDLYPGQVKDPVKLREVSREKTTRKRGSTGPRKSRAGLVSVGDIADKLGVSPREARGVLRKSKLEKPSAGWAWPPDEVDEVTDLIKKGLKK